MTGTNDTKVTLESINDNLNSVLDRLCEIEMILNDPMHGIELPEGVNVGVGEQPTVDMSSMFSQDNLTVSIEYGDKPFSNQKDNMNDT
jgi:hypothetical protein